MKVLLIFIDSWPTNGGGHTFSSALKEQIRRQPSLLNTYLILERDPDGGWRLDGISTAKEINLTIKELFDSRFYDFIFYCDSTPLHTPLSSIPYGCVVWDVGHRDYPELNEVSRARHDEFGRRESALSGLGSASLVLVGSDILKHKLSCYYGLDIEKVIVNKLPLTLTHEDILHAGALSTQRRISTALIDNPNIIYPAMLWDHKNHTVVLEAVKCLQLMSVSINPTIFLTGADKGAGSAKIKGQIFCLGLAESVKICGFLPRHELHRLMMQSDILVYPSILGPDNLPPLEAMAMGLPTVHSDSPWAQDQLGSNVLYFDPFSPYKLAESIIRLCLDASDRIKLILGGLDCAGNRTVDRYVSLLDTSLFRVSRIIALNS